MNLSDEMKYFLLSEKVEIRQEPDVASEENGYAQEDLTRVTSHSENLEAGLSIGESRRRLIRQAEFHREPWLPNLPVYRNDLDTNLEESFGTGKGSFKILLSFPSLTP